MKNINTYYFIVLAAYTPAATRRNSEGIGVDDHDYEVDLGLLFILNNKIFKLQI